MYIELYYLTALLTAFINRSLHPRRVHTTKCAGGLTRVLASVRLRTALSRGLGRANHTHESAPVRRQAPLLRRDARGGPSPPTAYLATRAQNQTALRLFFADPCSEA